MTCQRKRHGVRYCLTQMGQAQSSFEDFARDYADSTQEFAECFISQLASSRTIDESASGALRSEGCAAVWVAMQAVLNSAPLTAKEREELLPVLARHMTPFWRRHCVDDRHVEELMAYRPAGNHDAAGAQDLIAAAAGIVGELLKNTGVPKETQPFAAHVLETGLAHRMLTDLRRFDTFRHQQRE
jgi:hypothetical protein